MSETWDDNTQKDVPERNERLSQPDVFELGMQQRAVSSSDPVHGVAVKEIAQALHTQVYLDRS